MKLEWTQRDGQWECVDLDMTEQVIGVGPDRLGATIDWVEQATIDWEETDRFVIDQMACQQLQEAEYAEEKSRISNAGMVAE